MKNNSLCRGIEPRSPAKIREGKMLHNYSNFEYSTLIKSNEENTKMFSPTGLVLTR